MMVKVDKSRLARTPYLKKTDVGRLSGYRRKDLDVLFKKAQEIDKQELGINYMFDYKVRTKTVAKLIGYSLKELLSMYPENKKSAPDHQSEGALDGIDKPSPF